MVSWLSENLGTVLISAVIAGLVVLAVICLIRNRKKGRNCSCGCEGCLYSDSCKSFGKKRPG